MKLVDKLYEKAVNLQKKVDSASMGHPVSAWVVEKRKQLMEEQES